MRRHKFFGILMLMVSGLLFVQCTSDPIAGPPGQDGRDGIDGIDGQDGVSGTASCVSCHNNTLRGEIAASFDLSAHGSGSVGFAEGRGGSPGNVCAQCHGSEGFIDWVTIGAADTLGYENPTTINCSTCHSNHRTFDFENDGPDYALRNPDPSSLSLAPSTTIDFGDASNNCIACHQPRPSYPIPALNADGTYVVTSTRFAPHYGPQSTMLEGVLGAELPGAEAYPARASAAHRTDASCVSCHMGESNVASVGGHSWNPVEENCIECHGSVPGEASGYTADMATLLALLRNVEGVAYEVDSEGDPVFDANGDYIPTTTPVIGIIQANDPYRTNTGIFSDVAAMAAWNYTTVYHDQSRGIHNPEYTKALIKNSIEALQNEN